MHKSRLLVNIDYVFERKRSDEYLRRLVYLTEFWWKDAQMKRNARVGNHIAPLEKGNWNPEKNAKSAACGEIAIESGDEEFAAKETRVALPKGPYRAAP